MYIIWWIATSKKSAIAPMASEWATKAITEYPNLLQKCNCDHRHVLISAKFSTRHFQNEAMHQNESSCNSQDQDGFVPAANSGRAGLLVFLGDNSQNSAGRESGDESRRAVWQLQALDCTIVLPKICFHCFFPKGPLRLLSHSYSFISTILLHDKINCKRNGLVEGFFETALQY